tara:strand:+ start:593 stop:943 length:351 start_codon:yes stop_codon:yes gene_type:complete
MNTEQFEGMEIRAGLPRIKARNVGSGYHMIGVRDAEIMLRYDSGQHLERRFCGLTRSQRNNYVYGVNKVSQKNSGCLKVISRTKRTSEPSTTGKRDATFIIMFRSDFEKNREDLTS